MIGSNVFGAAMTHYQKREFYHGLLAEIADLE